MLKNISVLKLKEYNVGEWLRFTFYSNPDKFRNEFKKIGILINSEEDLIHLQYADKKYNVLNICKMINISEIDLRTNIKFTDI